MPKRITAKSVQVLRDGELKTIKPNTEFNFTAAELDDIKRINPRALKVPEAVQIDESEEERAARLQREQEARVQQEAKDKAEAERIERENAEAVKRAEEEQAAARAAASGGKPPKKNGTTKTSSAEDL